MKKRLSVFALAFLAVFAMSTDAFGYGDVRLRINDGISNASIRSKMEKAVSQLMTEVNRADADGSDIDLYGIPMTIEGRQQMKMLWENVHFSCDEQEIVERCLITNRGYQIRNIPLTLKPFDEVNNSPVYQEAVINFTKDGRIVSFHFTISANMYTKVMQNKVEISDIRRRMEILDYVEHFRTSYNQKDMSFLRQVFSDDALIITGKVIKVTPSEVFPNGTKITYRKQSKQQYLSNLDRAFKNTRYIHVSFDDIKIVAHPTRANVYGVTVHQSWDASNYSDEGYVFMVWDFTNEYEPKIHVRTWQPDYLDRSSGIRINPDDVFTLGDFTL